MPPDLRGLIDALTETPETVGRLVKDLSEADLRVKESPEEFSVIENVCHLRDIEIEGYTIRISRILNENNPLLPDIDGGRLAVERQYNSQSLAEALQSFSDARNLNTQKLRGLTMEQFDRAGTLQEVGVVTIGKLLMMMLHHDADHVREVTSLLARSGIQS